MKMVRLEIKNSSENHYILTDLLNTNEPITIFSPSYLVTIDEWVNSEFESDLEFNHLSESEAEQLVSHLRQLSVEFSILYRVFYK